MHYEYLVIHLHALFIIRYSILLTVLYLNFNKLRKSIVYCNSYPIVHHNEITLSISKSIEEQCKKVS